VHTCERIISTELTENSRWAVNLCSCAAESRPNVNVNAPIAGFGTLGIDSFIIGGSNANAGEWPWQLSQQRKSSTDSWSHSCGASLLSSLTALSAAHCVDGA
jgi:secreted trypsin-like serine protease